MADLRLIETSDGGDIVLMKNDIDVIDGLQNMPYIAMFGGDVTSSTKEIKEGEQRFDFWGNDLLYQNQPKIQFNSDTERLLNTTALNSSARLLIEQTVKSDLDFMGDFATVTVAASIVSADRLKILIKIQEPDNVESNEFTYIWDATKNELNAI